LQFCQLKKGYRELTKSQILDFIALLQNGVALSCFSSNKVCLLNWIEMMHDQKFYV